MALELNDLTDEERVALVGLVELAIEADGRVTDPEAKQLRAIIAALGTKAYEAAADQADESFGDEDDLWTFLATIKRQEARELIYETVLEVVLADAPLRSEGDLLDRLSRLWQVKPRIVDPPPQ